MKKTINWLIIGGLTLAAVFAASYLISLFSTIGFAAVSGIILMAAIFIIILKNPFLGLILIIFALPFERIPTIDVGFFTLKLDQLFAGFTIISYLLKLFLDRRRLVPYPIGWPLTLFLFASLISVFYAEYFSRAAIVFVFILFMIVVSWLVVNMVDSKEKLIKIMKIVFIAALITCAFGFYQFLGDAAGLPLYLTGLKDIYSKIVLGFPRIQAFSMEPLYLANYLFMPLGLAAGLYFFKQDKLFSSSRLLLLIIIIVIIIILGISRGAYIALAGLVLFLAAVIPKRILTWRNIIATVLGILIISGIGIIFLNFSNPDAPDKFISHAKVEDFAKGESVQKRLADYQKALVFWQQKPWFGIGPGNYGPYYQATSAQANLDIANYDIVNNQYLETLTETGVLGLAFLILAFVVLFVRSVKAYFSADDLFLRASLVGLAGAFVAILVQYNFFSTLYIMHIWVLIGLIIAVQNLCFSSRTPRESSRGNKPDE